MWVREVAWVDPAEALSRLEGLGRACLLESAMTHDVLGRYSYLAVDPFGTFTIRHGQAFWNGALEAGAPLDALRDRLAASTIDRRPDLPPFQGGAIGYVGYEFGWSLEGRRAPVPADVDDAHLAFHDAVVAFDHVERRCIAIATGHPEPHAARRQRRAAERLDALVAAMSTPVRRLRFEGDVPWRSDVPRETYRAGVERVKDYVRAGDIYQANVARRFTARLPEGTDRIALYRTIRDANPAPFAAFLDCGAHQILSTSPELFLRCDGRHVETRPIKGTARRHDDDVADAAAAARLLGSAKDRAENVMIVDLLRNDLSRVCEPRSVEVPALCTLETYAGLHHLVSAVTGDLAPGRDALDLLAATFPGGSITGAPKIRAMEIIAEIEGRPRGVYCGAIGWFGFDGALDLNIAIRTVTVRDTTMDLWTGGGITILSDPDAEYEETQVKARRILSAFARSPADVDA